MRDFFFIIIFFTWNLHLQQPKVYCDRRVFCHPTAKVKPCATWIWPLRHWRLQKHLHSLHTDSAHLFWPKLVLVLKVDKHTDSEVKIRSLSVLHTPPFTAQNPVRSRRVDRKLRINYPTAAGAFTQPSPTFPMRCLQMYLYLTCNVDLRRSGKACIQKRESSAQWKKKPLKKIKMTYLLRLFVSDST